ncbi:MAG: trehalose-phosphatase [Hyphomicrobiales bacterium]|nr:trehalose-phosphatase [Hyphomicrobiales bacterium]MBV9431387.1 trehalose-phosphatase [Hyphomicrobiales bacterium]MBV9740533.1 trehalose-phosphatase [Hyphomicrobiales bacterium]
MPSTSADEFQDGLKIERTALFLDVDGTLLDLAPRPGAVFVPPSLIDSLARADDALGGALALVSGRSIDDLDRLFAPLKLRASGVHGAQTRFSPNKPKEADEEAEGLPRQLWMALTEVLFDFPGTFAENKRYSFAVHYRTVPMLKPRLREALQCLLASYAALQLDMIHGHSVFEIKPRGFDKGKAIDRFISREPFRGRIPIFVGDDATDESGFAAVVSHGGRAFSVGRERPGASFVFPAPENVRCWLARFGQRRGST